jgi:hypothetical protein
VRTVYCVRGNADMREAKRGMLSQPRREMSLAGVGGCAGVLDGWGSGLGILIEPRAGYGIEGVSPSQLRYMVC